MEIFPFTVQCISSIFGLSFSSKGKLRHLIFVLTILFHICYIYNVIITVEFFNENKDDAGISVQVLQVCRTCAAIFILTKFFLIYIAKEKIEKLTSELVRQRRILNIVQMNSSPLKCCPCSLMTLILSIFYYLTTYILLNRYLIICHKFQRFFYEIRDCAECDLVYNLCRYVQDLVAQLNLELEDMMFGLNRESPEVILKTTQGIEQNKIEVSISFIRKMSKIHFDVTNCMKEFERILSFNMTLLLARYFVEIVSNAYYFYAHVGYKDFHTLIWTFIWVVKTITPCIILVYSWASCQIEANRTVIILHDIWNKYAERKGIDKKLLYLQFISMRFLSCKLKFTAYGFFPLDWSFLHTIVASATTYIIILVQLKK